MSSRRARSAGMRGAVPGVALAVFAFAATPVHARQDAEVFRWQDLPPLPSTPFAVGAHGDALMAFVSEGDGRAHAWVLEDPAGAWKDAGALTPRGVYGMSSTADGVVVAAGRAPQPATVWRLRWDPRGATLLEEHLAASPSGALLGPEARFAGSSTDPWLLSGGFRSADWELWRSSADAGEVAGDDAEPDTTTAWTQQPFPSGSTSASLAAGVIVTQTNGAGEEQLLLVAAPSDRPHAGEAPHAFVRDLKASASAPWREVAPPPADLSPSAAAPLGQAHVIVASRDGALHAYHLITDTWAPAGRVAGPVRGLAAWRKGLVLLDADGLSFATAAPREPALGIVDGAVIVGYLLLLVGMGAWFSRRERGTDDYFLAGKRIPWWAAGLSLFATQLSAITFLSTPAVSFATDWLLLPSWFGILFFAPIAVAFYLPRYLRLDVRTAYEFLERRFHVSVRWFGCASFVVFQFARMGVVVYLPALALEFATGLPLAWCIVVMGVLATVYTVLGGMEAVVWTDVLQTLVLLGGVGATLVLVVAGVGDVGAALELAAARGKTQVLQSGWSLTEAVTWSIALGGLFLQFGPYTADQAMVQRYLTTKDRRTAARGIWLNGWMSVPAGFLFMLVGTALWIFYRAHPERLHVGMSNDQIFPLFLAHELPVGLAGLVIAGLFAAAMSTLDSGMHAIATTLTHDVYRRLRRVDDRRALRVARTLTVAAGILGTATALVLASGDIRSLLLFFLKALGLISSALAGVFFLGVFTRRANAPGVLCGAAAAVALLAWLAFGTDVYLFVYPLAGIPCAVVVGYVASLWIPVPPRDDAVPD